MIEIIVALIAGGVSLVSVVITSIVTNHIASKQMKAQTDQTAIQLQNQAAVMEERIKELTREVRMHNDFARRIPAVEENIKFLDREIEELKHNEKERQNQKAGN